MWLILIEPNDPLGPWLADGLRRRTLTPVVALSTQDFLDRGRLEQHRNDDEAWFHLETEDGLVVDSREVTGAINRLRTLPLRPISGSHLGSGRKFSDAPAILVSCLAALRCPMLNPPGSSGLGPDVRLDFEWAVIALQAGLRSAARQTAPLAAHTLLKGPSTSADAESARVLVIDHEVLTPPDVTLPARTLQACCCLAQFARTPMLAVDLRRQPGGEWMFVDADPRPDPSTYGSAALDALAEALAPSMSVHGGTPEPIEEEAPVRSPFSSDSNPPLALQPA
jgi:hypothetical protein